MLSWNKGPNGTMPSLRTRATQGVSMRTRFSASQNRAEIPSEAAPINDGPIESKALGAAESTSSIRGTKQPASTRASRVWVRIFPAIVLLTIILLFVFQNLRRVQVNFATATGYIPLALALLVASALGGLLVLAVGSIRIVQLRKVIRDLRSSNAPISTRDDG